MLKRPTVKINQKAKGLFNQAMTLHQQNSLIEAKPLYQQVLKLLPNQPDALHMLGVIAFQENDFDSAVNLMLQALALIPNHPTLLFNLGNAQRAVGNLHSAETMYLAALKFLPEIEKTEALKNLGNVYKEKNDYAKALETYDALLSLQPNHSYTQLNKALALLTTGRLQEGWPLYEARLAIDKVDHSRFLEHPLAKQWDGSPLAQPLLVLPEQGLGDQIFYGALLSDLEKKGMIATVCLDGRLIDLFSRSFKSLRFIQPTELRKLAHMSSGFGAQIHLASLAQFYRNTTIDFNTITSPFLFADRIAVNAIQKRLQSNRKLVCGLSWDSKHVENGRTKRMPLIDLLPTLQLPDIEFVDLQYGDTKLDRQKLVNDHGIAMTHFDDIDNFYDINNLAALIQACDVVLTVSNSTAHLAAALGKPTLVMLPHHTPLWYWHLDSMHSPWYPTVTLLRQATAGDWQPVVDQVTSILRGLSQRTSL
jgi:tetratricopeptide (TPR) repeat protein